MGWTSFHREDHNSVKDTLARELASPNWKIIDSSVVSNEYYAAVEYTGDHSVSFPKGSVHALICLLRHDNSDYYNFAYKDMSEDMGPFAYHCPKRILDKLTPTDNEYANKWRAACRARFGKARPKAGQTVIFAEPIPFRNGQTLATFQYVKNSRFSHDGFYYRVTGWKDREYTITA